ncbi:hypothetical protein ACH4GG_27290 [Streptomyces albidoflavus]|uniref:hypothetical protein n=1 Tax=Streptomyces albidoflavus TaxID=1886 RepID=UPI000A573F47|nr:hypothetical protein [Streptomyces albidoflavus]RZE18397.1 hypothetical protein C0Q96_28885 [Streptomyces albidoflavus]
MSPGRIVRSVSDGSVIIVRWTYGRLAALRTADGDPVLPVALALLAASALTAAVVAAPLIVAGAWIVAAWIAAPAIEEAEEEGDDGEEEAEEAPAGGPEEAAEEGPEVAPAEPPLPTREELATALHAVADPHAHTAAVATHLGVPAERVRAGLKAAGIPTTGACRMGGKPSTGVKAEHIPPLSPSGEATQGAVVASPLTSNNNSNNAPTVERREGMLIIRDPADTHRHHKVA